MQCEISLRSYFIFINHSDFEILAVDAPDYNLWKEWIIQFALVSHNVEGVCTTFFYSFLNRPKLPEMKKVLIFLEVLNLLYLFCRDELNMAVVGP